MEDFGGKWRGYRGVLSAAQSLNVRCKISRLAKYGELLDILA